MTVEGLLARSTFSEVAREAVDRELLFPFTEPWEVVTARTLTGKVFRLGENKFRQIIGISPKHVARDVAAWVAQGKAYTGGWDDINPRFGATADGLVSGRGWYEVTIRNDTPCAVDVTTVFGDRVSMAMGGLDLRSVAPEITAKGAIWRDVAEDFDVELHLKPTRVQWFKRLKSDRAPRAWTWDVIEHRAERITPRWHALGWDNADGVVRRFADEMFFRKHRQAHTSFEAARTATGWHAAESWDGLVIEKLPVTRIKTLTREVVYPVWIDQDLDILVTADNDDGGESVNAATWYTLRTVYGNLSAAGYGEHPGWRFLDLALASADTIDDPTVLKVQVESVVNGGVTSQVTIDDVDSAAAWANGSRPSAHMTAPAAAAVSLDQTSTGLKTIDVKAHVAEVVARGGWDAGGKDVRFAAKAHTGDGTQIGRSGDREHSGSNESNLEIDFTAGGGGGTTNRLRRRMLMGMG